MKARTAAALATCSLLCITSCKRADWEVGPGASDFSAKLVGDYSLNRFSAHEITVTPEVWEDATPRIPAKVVECATDRQFILAKRQRLKRRNQNPQDTYEEPAPGIFDYWILDTADQRIFGPLDELQFAAKRQELTIAETVTLKDVYTYRP